MGNLSLRLGLAGQSSIGVGVGAVGLSVLETHKQTLGGSTSASKAYTLGVTPELGDILIYVFFVDGFDFTTHTPMFGWVELYDAGRTYAMYKVADGTETAADVITFVASSNGATSAGICLRVSGAGTPQMGTTNTTNDPTSFSPSGGEAEYLWMACLQYKREDGMVDEEGITAYPTGFTDNTIFSQNFLPDTPNATGGGRGGLGIGYKVEVAVSQDPGTFTLAGGGNGGKESFVVAIPAV